MTKLRLVNQTLVIFEAHKRLLVRPTAHDHCLRQIWTGGLISNVLLYSSSGTITFTHFSHFSLKEKHLLERWSANLYAGFLVSPNEQTPPHQSSSSVVPDLHLYEPRDCAILSLFPNIIASQLNFHLICWVLYSTSFFLKSNHATLEIVEVLDVSVT
jgi:hypothetical protein